MQQFITQDSLLAHGINLDGQDVNALLAHLNDTLEERVGSEITESLNDTQIQTLVEMQEKATDEEIGEWLTQNVPDFTQIIQEEIDSILDEFAEDTKDDKAA